MCDPVSFLVGALGVSSTTAAVGLGIAGGLAVSKMGSSKQQQAASPASELPDPAEERARAEAEAAQKANARLATDNRRRREQGSLLAKGAPPTFGFGDATTDAGASPIGSTIQPVTRGTTARKASLMSQGAAASGASFGGGGGGSRSGRYSENLV